MRRVVYVYDFDLPKTKTKRPGNQYTIYISPVDVFDNDVFRVKNVKYLFPVIKNLFVFNFFFLIGLVVLHITRSCKRNSSIIFFITRTRLEIVTKKSNVFYIYVVGVSRIICNVSRKSLGNLLQKTSIFSII